MNGCRRVALLLPVLIAAVSCARGDPTAPEPSYIATVTSDGYPFFVGSAKPAIQCPPFDPVVGATTRRRIAGGTATIALPDSAVTVDFDRAAGSVILLGGLGTIGVSYGTSYVVRVDARIGGARQPILATALSGASCHVQVGGRSATIFADAFPDPTPTQDPRTIEFAPFVLITSTDPSGRVVNITVSASRSGLVTFDAPDTTRQKSIAVRRLLTYVGSLTW